MSYCTWCRRRAMAYKRNSCLFTYCTTLHNRSTRVWILQIESVSVRARVRAPNEMKRKKKIPLHLWCTCARIACNIVFKNRFRFVPMCARVRSDTFSVRCSPSWRSGARPRSEMYNAGAFAVGLHSSPIWPRVSRFVDVSALASDRQWVSRQKWRRTLLFRHAVGPISWNTWTVCSLAAMPGGARRKRPETLRTHVCVYSVHCTRTWIGRTTVNCMWYPWNDLRSKMIEERKTHVRKQSTSVGSSTSFFYIVHTNLTVPDDGIGLVPRHVHFPWFIEQPIN